MIADLADATWDRELDGLFCASATVSAAPTCDAACVTTCQGRGTAAPVLMAMTSRAALTGRSTSPGVFDVLAVLGRDESLARISDQID